MAQGLLPSVAVMQVMQVLQVVQVSSKAAHRGRTACGEWYAAKHRAQKNNICHVYFFSIKNI